MQPIAWVTGASRGIGAAVVAALAGSGVRVVGFARNRSAMETLRDELAAIGQQFVPVACDLLDDRARDAAITRASRDIGPPAVLVNNAAVGGPYTPVDGISTDRWMATMHLNVAVPFLLTRHCLPTMRNARFGRIVNVASVLGTTGSSGSAAYIASKHALIGLTRAVAAECAEQGITCNAVCPGYIATDMLGPLANDEKLRRRIPAGRIGSPEEVAALIAWLCSPAAGYVNGSILTVDGGLSADLGAVGHV